MVHRRWLDMQWLMDNWHVIIAERAMWMIHLMHVIFVVSRQKVGLMDSALRSTITVFIFMMHNFMVLFCIIRLRMNLLFVI